MKKIITLLMAALVLVGVSGCESDNSADSYADKLARGEIAPDVEIAEGDSAEKKTKTKKDVVDTAEEIQQPIAESENKEIGGVEQPEKTEENIPANDPSVKLTLSEAEMGTMIDVFDDEYKSFEVIQMQNPDFFMGKNLRLAAIIAEHKLTPVYDRNIKAMFSQQKMIVSSADETGAESTSEYFMYSASENISKTPSGRDFAYVSYGSDKPEGGEINGVIGVIARVTCSKPELMVDATAEEYVLLIESGQPEVYQLFFAE